MLEKIQKSLVKKLVDRFLLVENIKDMSKFNGNLKYKPLNIVAFCCTDKNTTNHRQG